MKKKTIWGIAAMVAAAALALTGCTGGGGNAGTTGDGDGSAPTTLSIGTVFDKTGWEIGQSGAGFNAPFFSAVYDSLVLIDENSKPYGQLATSIDTSDDELTYTFHLQDGVTFSDGEKFDADAAIANFDYLRKSAYTAPAYVNVAKTTKVDDATVEVTMTKPDPGFLFNLGLGNSYMVSPKVLSDAKYTQETSPEGGSGAYTFDASKSTAGQDYYFTKNPDAWQADKFPWESVEIHVIADSTAMSNAMSTGVINVEFASWSDQLKADADANNWTITDVMSGWSGLMLADRTGDKFTPLGNLKVRQALNMAFDRDAITKAANDPNGVATNQVFSTIDPELDKLYPYDVAKAKQLLTEAGYPDGFTLTLPTMSLFASTAATVKQSLEQIGIKVEVQNLDPATYNQQVFAGNFPVYMAFLQLYGNPTKTIADFFTPGMSNPFDSAKDIPELQSLFTDLHTAGADVDAIAQKFNSYATENAWFVVWNHGASYYVTVPGITIRPVQGLYVPNLEQFLPAGS
ncbi:ABC transporter substrate-binding protein [Microbacterium sp. KR10-403]|uniref:ABC transporter substrate-binding protein n=1 Tax=Microbacterium sp. KR10-403 TaxID=3158581 RepID=UPI0032E4688F